MTRSGFKPDHLARLCVGGRPNFPDQFIQFPAGDALGVGVMKSTCTAAAFAAVIQIPDLLLQPGQIQRPDLFRAAFFQGRMPAGNPLFPAHQGSIAQPHLGRTAGIRQREFRFGILDHGHRLSDPVIFFSPGRCRLKEA